MLESLEIARRDEAPRRLMASKRQAVRGLWHSAMPVRWPITANGRWRGAPTMIGTSWCAGSTSEAEEARQAAKAWAAVAALVEAEVVRHR
jgi:hypothetical protein